MNGITGWIRVAGNVPYNGQDVIQLVFNPHNDQSNMFVDPNGDPGTAAIYDMVVDTSDEFGPDIYRHGPQLTTDQRASIAIDGQITATGYILEAAIPWAVAGEKLNVLKAGCVEPFVPDDLADAGAVRIDCVVLNRHDPSASFMPGWDRDPGRQPQTAPPSSLMIGSCRMIRLGRHRLGPGAKGRTSHTR